MLAGEKYRKNTDKAEAAQRKFATQAAVLIYTGSKAHKVNTVIWGQP